MKPFKKLREAYHRTSSGPWQFKDGQVWAPENRVWDVSDANDRDEDAQFAVEAKNAFAAVFETYDGLCEVLVESKDLLETVAGKVSDRGTQRLIISFILKLQRLESRIVDLSKEKSDGTQVTV